MSMLETFARAAVVLLIIAICGCVAWRFARAKRASKARPEAWDDKTRYGDHPGAVPQGEDDGSKKRSDCGVRAERGRAAGGLHDQAVPARGWDARGRAEGGETGPSGGRPTGAQPPQEGPPEAPQVEGDLALDDGRPTDPGEEITEVSRYAWDEESGMQPAARKLGRMVGKDRGDLP